MKLQNIVKIISALLGVLGGIFLLRILGAGDDDIKLAASMGDYGVVSPLVELAKVILYLTIGITMIFTIKGLFSDKEKLKKAALSIGFFALVLLISYAFSEGLETPMKDGEFLSANASKWVGTGIRMFYLLAIIAISLMLASGLKRIIKK
jgi:hypothetical protein|tara:strand:- start:162 stop:611 length:450 start_codon:yes stop_codon:yes gene_type:complete